MLRQTRGGGARNRHLRFPRLHAHLRTQPEGEVHSASEDCGQATPQRVEGGRRMVPEAPTRSYEPAAEVPERQTPQSLPVLRSTDELLPISAVLPEGPEGPAYLAGVAESR